jgi:hypothetical protein
MTPGAIAIGSSMTPMTRMEHLITFGSPVTETYCVPPWLVKSVPKIVAHLAPDDDVVGQGKLLEDERSACSVCDSPKWTV